MKKFLTSIELKLALAFERINVNTHIGVKELSFYRIFFCIIYLFYFIPSYTWIGEIPDGFFFPKPLNIVNIFSEFPSYYYFKITDYLIISLLVFALIGYKAKISFILLFVLTTINSGFSYGLNKIDHYFLTSLIFLVFAFTNSATNFAIKPEKKQDIHNLVLSIFGICIVFGYFTAGLQKAYHWIDFNLETSGTLRWIYDIYFQSTSKPILSELFLNANPILLELMDYSGVFFELSGILFLFYSKKSWKFYLLFASVFHLTNTLILSISFTFHFPIFGLWLLSKPIFKHKILMIPFLLGFLLKGIYSDIYLWIYAIGISIYGVLRKS
jgi:hypothetical protein